MTECELVNAAEKNAQHDYGLDPARFEIEQDLVEYFARSTVTLAGFECEIFPMIVFMDIGDSAGACEKSYTGRGELYYGLITFNPEFLSKWIVCHEFAHWLAPRELKKNEVHNATFREIMVKLVQQGIGEYASWGLSSEYEKHGFRYIFA